MSDDSKRNSDDKGKEGGHRDSGGTDDKGKEGGHRDSGGTHDKGKDGGHRNSGGTDNKGKEGGHRDSSGKHDKGKDGGHYHRASGGRRRHHHHHRRHSSNQNISDTEEKTQESAKNQPQGGPKSAQNPEESPASYPIPPKPPLDEVNHVLNYQTQPTPQKRSHPKTDDEHKKKRSEGQDAGHQSDNRKELGARPVVYAAGLPKLKKERQPPLVPKPQKPQLPLPPPPPPEPEPQHPKIPVKEEAEPEPEQVMKVSQSEAEVQTSEEPPEEPVQPKSRPRVQSQAAFEKIKKRRKPRLEMLLNVLKTLEKPAEETQMLQVLQQYRIPEQKKLFDFLFERDPVPSTIGGNIKLFLSHVLRTHCGVNTYNNYSTLSRYMPTLQSIRFKGVKTHPCEFAQTEAMKARKRRRQLEGNASVANDEEHEALLKEFAINQISSLPLTLMYETLNDQIKVVEEMCYNYSDITGSSSSCTKEAVTHYNLMKKHLEALEFIGLRPMPRLTVFRKFEEPAKEENAFLTSSSSSEDEDELETFLQQHSGPTQEELDKLKREQEDDRIIEKAGGLGERLLLSHF